VARGTGANEEDARHLGLVFPEGSNNDHNLIDNQESRIKNQESRIKDQGSRIKDQESGIKNQGSRIRSIEYEDEGER